MPASVIPGLVQAQLEGACHHITVNLTVLLLSVPCLVSFSLHVFLSLSYVLFILRVACPFHRNNHYQFACGSLECISLFLV